MSEPRPQWPPDRLLPYWNSTVLQVLRATIVAEAVTERAAGQLAVGCVIRNRSLLRWGWSSDIKTICLQPWQFSCWWGIDFAKRKADIDQAMQDESRFPSAHVAALKTLRGEPDITDLSLHYFNPRLVLPSWASHLVRKCRIGSHDFYGYV